MGHELLLGNSIAFSNGVAQTGSGRARLALFNKRACQECPFPFLNCCFSPWNGLSRGYRVWILREDEARGKEEAARIETLFFSKAGGLKLRRAIREAP